MSEPHELEKQLRKIDEIVSEKRIAQLETVTAAMSRGVQIFVHPQVKDGQPAFLVSPGDYKILKEIEL